MVITYNRHNQIKFPVYPLGSSNWDSTDGLVFIDNLILDDRNMTGDTLGKRRLQTPHKGLYQLKRSIETFVGGIAEHLEQMQTTLFEKAKAYRDSRVHRLETKEAIYEFF